MHFSPIPRFLLIASAAMLLAVFQPTAGAQRGGGHFAAGGGRGFRFGPSSSVAPNSASRSFSNFASRYGSLAYLTEPFFAEDFYDAGYPVASQLPAFIVQGSPSGAAATSAETASAPIQPLMIELQGDRYVRVSGDDRSGAEMLDRGTVSSREQATGTGASHADPSPAGASRTAKDELAPAVLVFRDGHREEVLAYTITEGVLYASGDFYRNGSWNRKIELSSLSLPETVKASQERGVEFRLPTAPNEVIVRP